MVFRLRKKGGTTSVCGNSEKKQNKKAAIGSASENAREKKNFAPHWINEANRNGGEKPPLSLPASPRKKKKRKNLPTRVFCQKRREKRGPKRGGTARHVPQPARVLKKTRRPLSIDSKKSPREKRPFLFVRGKKTAS